MRKQLYLETTVVSYLTALPNRDLVVAGHQEATRELWTILPAREDALHVAIAAVNGIDIIVTWNFAHLNNPFIRKNIRKVVEAAGYQSPEICSPNELLEVSP